jgi:glutamate carboxypeptidase
MNVNRTSIDRSASACVDEAAVLASLRELVECESSSWDPLAVSNCAALLSNLGERWLGRPAEALQVDGCAHVRWSFGRPRILLLGHFDTVWPTGTINRWPFEVRAGRASGPGVFDMKAGIIQLFAALAPLQPLDGVSVLLVGDEEIGGNSSRALIEEAAAQVEAVLVLEPSADGSLKIARKGIGVFEVDIIGKAAHAGLEPEAGVNATVEAAHQVLVVAGLADPALGTTVTPAALTSGTTVNTVPASARLSVDVRAATTAEMRRVEEGLMALTPVLADSVVRPRRISVRPPMQPCSSTALFARAQALADRAGVGRLRGAAVGGASDGNVTAALGVPTLDGLGAVGAGAHAEGEWVSVSDMLPRAALVRLLVRDILGLPAADNLGDEGPAHVAPGDENGDVTVGE